MRIIREDDKYDFSSPYSHLAWVNSPNSTFNPYKIKHVYPKKKSYLVGGQWYYV